MVKKSSNTKNDKKVFTVSKKKEKVEKKTEKLDTDVQKEKKKRYFRCLYEENGVVLCVGRYSGRKPKQAANKALTALVKSNKTLEGKEIIYGVVEQTRNSKRKKYYYSGCRKLLSDPVPVEIKKNINGNEVKETITYKHQSVVKKISEDQCKLIAAYNPKKEELEEGLDDASDQKPKKSKTAKKTTKKPVKKDAKKDAKKDTKKDTKKVEKEVEVKVVKKTKSVSKKS